VACQSASCGANGRNPSIQWPRSMFSYMFMYFACPGNDDGPV